MMLRCSINNLPCSSTGCSFRGGINEQCHLKNFFNMRMEFRDHADIPITVNKPEQKSDMKEEQFMNLNTGDIIKHKSSESTYVVTANYGSRVTAVRTVDLTNPNEWELVLSAKHVKP